MKRLFLPILFAVFTLLIACEEKPIDPVGNTTDKIIIDSLTANHLSVKAWDSTTINCYVQGENLIYTWDCDHGNFNGEGTQIKYPAGECCVGINTITCSVSNDSGQVSEEIQIEVTSYFGGK